MGRRRCWRTPVTVPHPAPCPVLPQVGMTGTMMSFDWRYHGFMLQAATMPKVPALPWVHSSAALIGEYHCSSAILPSLTQATSVCTLSVVQFSCLGPCGREQAQLRNADGVDTPHAWSASEPRPRVRGRL